MVMMCSTIDPPKTYSKERIEDMVKLIKTLSDLKVPGDKTHIRKPILEELKKLDVHETACVIQGLENNCTYLCTFVQLQRTLTNQPGVLPPIKAWWRFGL
jgi:hypothetical protein